jgi:hypothetical protein
MLQLDLVYPNKNATRAFKKKGAVFAPWIFAFGFLPPLCVVTLDPLKALTLLIKCVYYHESAQKSIFFPALKVNCPQSRFVSDLFPQQLQHIVREEESFWGRIFVLEFSNQTSASACRSWLFAKCRMFFFNFIIFCL